MNDRPIVLALLGTVIAVEVILIIQYSEGFSYFTDGIVIILLCLGLYFSYQYLNPSICPTKLYSRGSESK